MKVDQPIGNALWGPLFIRMTLGTYFILAGMRKLEDPVAFLEQVKALRVLPELGSTVFGIVLPYVEIACGGLFLIGFWTTLAGIIMAVLLGSFVYALGIRPAAMGPFNKDLILLAAVVSVLYTGAGSMSIDRFRSATASK